MQTVVIDTKNINDEVSFHQEFKNVMGFIEGYGMNMNAWIDCMSDIQEDEKGMTKKVKLKDNEMLCIEITGIEDFNNRLPQVMKELIECTAIVNQRYKDSGENKSICLKLL